MNENREGRLSEEQESYLQLLEASPGWKPEVIKLVREDFYFGLTKDQVVQCRVYIADVSYWDAINEVYGEFFGEHKPARIVVPVPALHFGCLVEIEAVAEVV